MKPETKVELMKIINYPGISWKVRIALLVHKFGFTREEARKLIGKEEEHY